MAFARTDSLFHFVIRHHVRLTTILGPLMVLSAVTEGLGFMLLVPMLAAVANHELAATSDVTNVVAILGLPVALAPLLVLFFFLVVLRSIIGYFRSLVGLRLRVAVVDGLRTQAWSALVHCEWRVLASMRQSRNASQLLGNVERVAHGVDEAVGGIANATTLLGIAVASIIISPVIAVGSVIGGVLVWLVFGRLRRRASALGEQLGHAYNRYSGELHQSLGALRIIKSFGCEAQAEVRVLKELRALRRGEFEFQRGLGLGQISLQTSGALVLSLLVWLAMSQWESDITSVLPLVALFARAIPLFGALQQNWQEWAHAQPSFLATQDILNEAESSRESDIVADASVLRPPIKLDRVTVSWPGRAVPALDAVSLTIPSCGIVALSGHSGAGKSTLADLIGGLLAPDGGEITASGVPLEGGFRRAWRRQVAYVQQEPVLFAGTIRENLRWAAPDASDERFWKALDESSAGFVRAMKGGLDASIGENGRELSGGERQRIVLARSLLRDPALLILDEATSALDDESERAIIAVLQRLKERLSILVISHRTAVVDIADTIVTLGSGRIVRTQQRRGARIPDR